MDIQMTDFENTCLIVLMGLIVNVVNHFNVDFIIPISQADANMERAHYRDAILDQKFWVKVNCLRDRDNFHVSNLQQSDFKTSGVNDVNSEEQMYKELYIHEILAGSEEHGYPGLYPLIRKFMEQHNYQQEHRDQIE